MTDHHSTIAIYPGSFDPPTEGHLDLIARGARLFDSLIVAVLTNTAKQPLFSSEERVSMLSEATSGHPNVFVESFGGLLVDFAAHRGATVVLRGVRAIADYEAELQIATLNRRMSPQLETVFLLAREQHSFISSRLIKEVVQLGGDVSQFVPAAVSARLAKKFPKNQSYK